MKRLIAIMNDGTTVNISADGLAETGDFFVATNRDEIVGAFDMAATVCIYLSEKRDE